MSPNTPTSTRSPRLTCDERVAVVDVSPRAPRAGRVWAYVGITLGGGVSVAANVAHSFVPPEHAASGWTPHVGAVVGAIFWPLFVLVAVEILARKRWLQARRWSLLRFGGIVPVALVAAVVSYLHLSGLLQYYGENQLTCLVGPLAVDGLMLMATGALIAPDAAVAEPTTSDAPLRVDLVVEPDRVDQVAAAADASVADALDELDARRQRRGAASSPRRRAAGRRAVVSTDAIVDAIASYVRSCRADRVEPVQREMIRLVQEATGQSVGWRRCVEAAALVESVAIGA